MNEISRTSIGDRLRAERERLSLTQEQFAEIGGASKRAQAGWEKGEQVPNAEFLASVAAAGVDVLFVITGQRTPRAADALAPDEAALIDNYKHADEEGRDAARRVLSSLAKPNRKAA